MIYLILFILSYLFCGTSMIWIILFAIALYYDTLMADNVEKYDKD